jgi:hypothetical protein
MIEASMVSIEVQEIISMPRWAKEQNKGQVLTALCLQFPEKLE